MKNSIASPVPSLMLLALSLSLAAPAARAEDTLSLDQVSALARSAVAAEAAVLNAELAGGGGAVYRGAWKDALLDAGITRVAEAYLVGKCTFSAENLASFLDSELNAADDDDAQRGAALGDTRRIYGRKTYRLLDQVCERAEARFRDRIGALTIGGEAVSLAPETAENLEALVFYPTRAGRPNFARTATKALGVILTGAMFIGSGGSLVGLPVGGLILSFAVPANTLLGLRNSLARTPALVPDADLRIDLTADERVRL